MALKKKPVTGMKDMLPAEMEIRDYLIGLIKETYKTFGFTSMETPCVEHIENLCSKQGGDNEKLIFKIMKRGEKLKISEAKEENDLADGGLRYDLTVPLARYYANHANELPSPFKALQIGNVWRADRPQRGRFRQFMQCDIDILGEGSVLAEIELILATTAMLGKLNFKITFFGSLYAGHDHLHAFRCFAAQEISQSLFQMAYTGQICFHFIEKLQISIYIFSCITHLFQLACQRM